MIRISVRGEPSEKKGSCLNLSNSGVFIGMKDPLPRGTRLTLIIDLEPVGKMIEADGVVVWARPEMPDRSFPPGVGVKFTRIDDEAQKLVHATVAEIRRRRSVASGAPSAEAPSPEPTAPTG